MASRQLQQMYVRIRAVIRKIPRGHVATYGQVAELAGFPGGARVAAASLKTSRPEHQLPWQRVIGKASRLRGRIAIHDPVGAAVQRQMLEAEGVAVGDSGLVALDVYGWLPAQSARAAKAGRSRGAQPARAVTGGSARGASLRQRPRSASRRRASSSRR